jgi:hypothetical protein
MYMSKRVNLTYEQLFSCSGVSRALVAACAKVSISYPLKINAGIQLDYIITHRNQACLYTIA